MYDVLVIGAGVTGCAVARELMRYKLSVAVLEREEDVCCGTSKANSAIVHAGYDAVPGSLKAEMNVSGNLAMESLCRELDVDFKKIGSLVVCLEEENRPVLSRLYDQGIANGVPGLRIIEQDELRKMEPHISDRAVAALYAPTGGIVCPFLLTIGLAENAAANGADFIFNTEVTGIRKQEDENGPFFMTETADGTYTSRVVVNAAGVYADVFHNMVSENKIHITARRGDYNLLDKVDGDYVQYVIFPLPTALGKGTLVSPTVHGNLIVGPTAIDVEDKEAISTTAEGIGELTAKAGMYVKNLPLRDVITSFAGLRAHEDGDDFIIGEVSDCRGFIDCAGIESPGLTSADAIGIRVAGIVGGILNPQANTAFVAERKGILNPKNLSQEEYAELIRKNPAYGNIICRCEMITEGEIIDAIHRTPGARSLDGVKRRTRAGMGRCQAGFCSPRTMEILARELGVGQEEITKSGGASKIIVGIDKDRL